MSSAQFLRDVLKDTNGRRKSRKADPQLRKDAVAESSLSAEALQKLATDIANDVAQRISEILGTLSTAALGCNPGPFDCPKLFACSAFTGRVVEPEGTRPGLDE